MRLLMTLTTLIFSLSACADGRDDFKSMVKSPDQVSEEDLKNLLVTPIPTRTPFAIDGVIAFPVYPELPTVLITCSCIAGELPQGSFSFRQHNAINVRCARTAAERARAIDCKEAALAQ